MKNKKICSESFFRHPNPAVKKDDLALMQVLY